MKRRTMLLLALDLVLAMLAAVMFVQFDNARSNAQRDQQDAAIVIDDLKDISAVRRPAGSGGEPSQQITAGLQAAANVAGIAQQLQSVEAGSARNADEPPTLAIRLGAVTLQQLYQFLTNLQKASQPLISTNIHLSVPQGPDAVASPGSEVWTAEVALKAAIGDTSR